ncbi:MAG: peptidase U32 family protein [Bacteroidota bacterium]|nr:peptidase U32 family protein [Bacteroidota bacterium]
MKNREIEIMSPVGSYESLMAAILGGANSVYFGAGHLNMRARSSVNFTTNDIKKIADLCRDNNIRSYLTLNTVVYNNEIPEIIKTLEEAKRSGITAVIASDFAVINHAREIGMEMHVSTQSNVSNIEAVKFFSDYANVMVLARELKLEQIEEICRQIEEENITGPSGELIRIEIFAHGALCMSISGKCYLSLHTQNYSANRGACLQPCRRAYTVRDKDEGHELDIENEYIMSPKDLCTIGFLDKLIEAGVKVFKIEGRGRSPEYVKTVTKCYREAVDSFLDGTYNKEKVDLWTEKLRSVYNRGFWEGYYMGKKTGEWTKIYGSQATKRKVYVGKGMNYFSTLKVAEFKVEAEELNVGDEIIITGPTTGVIETKVNEIRVDLLNVDKANKGVFCSIPVPEIVRRSDKLYKIVDA